MLKLNVNAARTGVLYHFGPDMKTVESIIENGLRTSKYAEPHMRKYPEDTSKIKNKTSKRYATDPTSAFVSLTRNPSIMPREGQAWGMWRYGVVFDADKLADIAKMLPYQYNTSNHQFDLTVTELDDDPGGFQYSTDTSDYKEVHSKEGEEETPLDQFLDMFYSLQEQKNIPLTFKEQRGSWTIHGELSKDYNFFSLPRLLQKLLVSCNFEAEDRAYFPKSKTSEFVPATRKAIVGIIVPDSEYYSEAVTKVTEKYPDLPVYAYRDPVNKLPKGENAVPRAAYRVPQ